MEKTLVIVAHPGWQHSSSYQLLVQTGQQLLDEQVTYYNLDMIFQENEGSFDAHFERTQLLAYARILLQFPLYWYQAPALLKIWLDTVFDESAELKRGLKGKNLGVVMIAGVRASHYQPGGSVGVTVADLLSPYQALATYYQMPYLKPFAVHQFSTMDETQKQALMIDYSVYLLTGQADDIRAKAAAHYQLLEKLICRQDKVQVQVELLRTIQAQLELQMAEIEELERILYQG